MEYLIVLDSDLVEESKDLFVEKYSLVRTSFETVYPQEGFPLFETLLDREETSKFEIYNEEGEEFDVESFVEKLEDYNLKQ